MKIEYVKCFYVSCGISLMANFLLASGKSEKDPFREDRRPFGYPTNPCKHCHKNSAAKGEKLCKTCKQMLEKNKAERVKNRHSQKQDSKK